MNTSNASSIPTTIVAGDSASVGSGSRGDGYGGGEGYEFGKDGDSSTRGGGAEGTSGKPPGSVCDFCDAFTLNDPVTSKESYVSSARALFIQMKMRTAMRLNHRWYKGRPPEAAVSCYFTDFSNSPIVIHHFNLIVDEVHSKESGNNFLGCRGHGCGRVPSTATSCTSTCPNCKSLLDHNPTQNCAKSNSVLSQPSGCR